MKKIAILIPSYKPGEYFRACLRSINMQSLDKDFFCVYIALNGPKDPYEQIIKSYLKEFSFACKYIYVEQPSVSNARNVLINASHEDYITFIDDDDMISSNYLECLLDVSAPHIVGISNVYGFTESCEQVEVNYIGRSFSQLAAFERSKVKTRKHFSSPWAKMIHRNVISDNLFDVHVSKGEDSLFMAQVSKNIFGLRKTPDTACYYVNQRIGSVTRSSVNSTKDVRTLSYLLRKYLSLLVNPSYDKLFISTRLIATLIKLFKVGVG